MASLEFHLAIFDAETAAARRKPGEIGYSVSGVSTEQMRAALPYLRAFTAKLESFVNEQEPGHEEVRESAVDRARGERAAEDGGEGGVDGGGPAGAPAGERGVVAHLADGAPVIILGGDPWA